MPYSIENMVEAMRSDKKNEDQRIDFVFPVSYGKWEERKMEMKEVVEIIKGLDV